MHTFSLLLDALPAIGRTQVDQPKSIHQHPLFDLAVELSVRVQTRRMVDLKQQAETAKEVLHFTI